MSRSSSTPQMLGRLTKMRPPNHPDNVLGTTGHLTAVLTHPPPTIVSTHRPDRRAQDESSSSPAAASFPQSLQVAKAHALLLHIWGREKREKKTISGELIHFHHQTSLEHHTKQMLYAHRAIHKGYLL